jgi:hypothetical protein
MLKTSILFLVFLNLFIISGCQKDTSPIIQNPNWLVNYIDQIKDDDSYYGAIIYLYKWNENYYYDVFVAQRSCIACEVYDLNGQKIVWNDESAPNYIENRKKVAVIWNWKDNH